MSFPKLIFLLLVLKMITSCSRDQDPTSMSCAEYDSSQDPLIIGDNDWIHHEETGGVQQNLNELAVGLVQIPKIYAKCTGFLINEDTLMTNNHCIPDASKSAQVTALFRHPDGSRKKYDCSHFILTNALLDFTLVKCAGSPGGELGWVGLSQERPVTSQGMYLVQENCDYIRDPRCEIDKYVSFGTIEKLQNNRIFHNADTLGGSSGSPIFSRLTQQVVGLHNSGYFGDTEAENMNLGITMSEIRAHIENVSQVKVYEYGSAQRPGETTIKPIGPCGSL